MIIRRRRGEEDGPGPNHIRIIVRSLGGEELLAADFARNAHGTEVKQFVARELDLYGFGFELLGQTDGCKVDGAQELRHEIPSGSTMELTLLKRALPRASSSRFLRLQSSVPEDARPTFQGRQDSIWATLDVVGPRLLLLPIMYIVLQANDFQLIYRALVVYLIYLIEALMFNAAARALKEIGEIGYVAAYIQRIKSAAPAVKIEARCWHWETRWRTVTDKDGRQHEESYEERVYTDTYTDTLIVRHWTDTSGDFVDGLAYFPLLQIHFDISWRATDEETEQEHDRARQALVARAQARDTNHDYKEFLRLRDVDGNEFDLPQSDMISTTSHHRPSWLGWQQYVIASVLGLSWPFRWWLAHNSIKGDFVFLKEVHSSPRATEGEDTTSNS